MNAISQLGKQILLVQILAGSVVYAITSFYDVKAIEFVLSIAGVVAIFFIVVSIFHSSTIEAAVSSSSLSAVFALLCLFTSAPFVAGIFFFISLTQAMLAARLAEQESYEDEIFAMLVLQALPVIGVVFPPVLRSLGSSWTKKG